jgi:hypothetical protein
MVYVLLSRIMGSRHSRKCAALVAKRCTLVLAVVLFCGCGARRLDRKWTLSDLEDPDVTVRIMAVKWAGDNDVLRAVPYLVDNLQNEDKAIRFYSIQALSRITGKDCGYDYKASVSSRATAVECWRDFLKLNGFAGNGS